MSRENVDYFHITIFELKTHLVKDVARLVTEYLSDQYSGWKHLFTQKHGLMLPDPDTEYAILPLELYSDSDWFQISCHPHMRRGMMQISSHLNIQSSLDNISSFLEFGGNPCDEEHMMYAINRVRRATHLMSQFLSSPEPQYWCIRDGTYEEEDAGYYGGTYLEFMSDSCWLIINSCGHECLQPKPIIHVHVHVHVHAQNAEEEEEEEEEVEEEKEEEEEEESVATADESVEE